jgi:hypothetical protein
VPAKSAIVSVLGQAQLLLPDLVHDALAANARAKHFFSLLQLARQRADGAAQAASDRERLADAVVRRLRVAVARMPEAGDFGRVVATADEAAARVLALERRMDDAARAAARAMVASRSIDGETFVLPSRFTAQLERASTR